MSGDPGAPPAWPEIDVSVSHGRALPRWTARSDHPEAGPIHGLGISRAGAVRSLLRDLRRARDRTAPPGGRRESAPP